jgi:N6-adenosine-specific RNA methylase IME4
VTHEAALAGKQLARPQKRYGVIYADPPWRFETWDDAGKTNTSADNHYLCSPPFEIMCLDVPSIAADDAVLFLWVTAPFLPQGLEVMRAWGFTYVTKLIWTKDRPGTGYWFRNLHEPLLVGTRGNIPKPAMGTQWPSVIAAPVGRHSEKPAAFYEMIEQYFPNLPKIELFARAARDGWDSRGFEAPHNPPGDEIP